MQSVSTEFDLTFWRACSKHEHAFIVWRLVEVYIHLEALK